MTTYHMTEQDKVVSHREMRKALYFGSRLIPSLDASDRECATALRAIPNIEQHEVLWRIVGSDGMWAAHQVLRP